MPRRRWALSRRCLGAGRWALCGRCLGAGRCLDAGRWALSGRRPDVGRRSLGRTTAVPTHTLLHGIRRRGLGGLSPLFFCFFLLSLFSVRFLFRCDFFGVYHIFLGQAWAEGKGEPAVCPPGADSGQEIWTKCTPP